MEIKHGECFGIFESHLVRAYINATFAIGLGLIPISQKVVKGIWSDSVQYFIFFTRKDIS